MILLCYWSLEHHEPPTFSTLTVTVKTHQLHANKCLPCTDYFLVPEKEHEVCSPSSIATAILSTNKAYNDNSLAVSVDCEDPVLSKVHKEATPNN